MGHIQNKGMEIVFNANPVSSSNLSWTINLNYSKNNNKIVKLDPSLKGRFNPDGGGEGFDMYIAEGGSIGDIYVNAFKRDDATGKVIYDDSNFAFYE